MLISRFNVLLQTTGRPIAIIGFVTVAAGIPLLVSPQQFVVADLGAFGPHLWDACVLPYEYVGLGRDNPGPSPSLCALGLMSMLLGGPLAQHVYLFGALCLAGASMFALLRRLGNPWSLSVVGALLYEFSPPMLNQVYDGGPGILVTGALMPLILLGTVGNGLSSWRGGALTGSALAAASYVNVQAPALAAFLLIPAVAVSLSIGARRYFMRIRFGHGVFAADVFTYAGIAAVIFLLAAIPVVQNLPGQLAAARSVTQLTASDLERLLALSKGPQDFFSPYLYVGVVPALIGFGLIGTRKGVHPIEIAAFISFLALAGFWTAFVYEGGILTHLLPYLGLFKDFIKLQIVMGVPLTIALVMCLRWATQSLRAGIPGLRPRLLAFGAIALVILPQALVVEPIIRTGQFGLNDSAKVPLGYETTLERLHQMDPDTGSYRILWMPMDFRFFRSFETLESTALLYRSDSSPDTRAAVLDTYEAIANRRLQLIAPLLATEGVKYVVLDLADGQLPGAPWQRGHMQVVSIYGTYLLAGYEEEYRDVLTSAPGLELALTLDGYLIYRNSLWQPILSQFEGVLRPSRALLTSLAESSSTPADLRAPIELEVPNLLFEPSGDSFSATEAKAALFSLTTGSVDIGDPLHQIRLMTNADLIFTGAWARGDPILAPMFAEYAETHSGSTIKVIPSVLGTQPYGARLTWVEYSRPLGTRAWQALVHELRVLPRADLTIRCDSPGCVIVDVLLVPIRTVEQPIARLAHAHSPLLRTPDAAHRSPGLLDGDWASIYQPAVTGYPSPLYDPTARSRWLGLAFGYLVLLTGLAIAAGLRPSSKLLRRMPRNPVSGSTHVEN